jgi:hypothetical protein
MGLAFALEGLLQPDISRRPALAAAEDCPTQIN